MMTEERSNQIVDAITAYGDTAKLLEMEPEEAVNTLNESGGDFTLEEIKEIGKSVQTVAKSMNSDGELDADALDNVSGGAYIDRYVLLAVGCIAVAAVCGW